VTHKAEIVNTAEHLNARYKEEQVQILLEAMKAVDPI